MVSLRNNFALLQYYLRERLWRHAETLANDVFVAQSDYTFRLWQAFCSDMQGNVSEAMREYKACDGKRDVHIAALTGLQVIYRRNKDQEGLRNIDTKLAADASSTNSGAWLQAAIILWHSGDSAKAREVINKVLDRDADYRDDYTSVQLVRGWIDIGSGRGAFIDKCGAMFERVLQAESTDNSLDIDALMGKVAYLEKKNQLYPAQELLNRCIVAHPFFSPALVVKARQQMKSEEWEQAVDLTQRILAKDAMNVEAIVLAILYLLVKEGRSGPAATNLNDLLKGLQQREPRNAHLYYSCAQCFSRLAGGNLQLLALTSQLAEVASQLQPANTDYAAEVAYQNLLKGDVKTAFELYKKASTAGDGNITPLLGKIKCAIILNKLDEAEQQVEFLNEIQTPQARNAELLYLTAMIRWRKHKDQLGSLEKLDQAVEVHRQDIAATPTGAELYTKLNLPMVLEIAREYLQHCRTEPPETGTAKHDPIAEKCRRVLDALLRHVPSSTEAQLLSSRVAFVTGDTDRATTLIAQCIRQDHTLAEAHLLSAQISLFVGNIAASNQSLEQALSLDFEVKDLPQYNLLRGTVLGLMGEHTEALSVLQHGLSLTKQGPTGSAKKVKMLSVHDHVSLHLQLAQTYLKLRDVDEAVKVIQQATNEFRNTAQLGRVSIAQAMIAARTNVDNALEILRSVRPSSDYYLAATAQMAQLYLTHRQNRKMYARCYEELCESAPSVQSFISLGEAYATIQEPEKAITAYEKAMAMDPNNPELAVRIGRTLVTTHDYQRALRYYRDAVAADGSRYHLRQDLALLYWRLGQIDKAITVLKESPVMSERSKYGETFLGMVEKVNLALLQTKIYGSEGGASAARDALIQARVFQNNLLTKMRGETSEVIFQQKGIAAMICFELGAMYLNGGVTDKAMTFFNEALKHDEANDKAMLALAKLYLSTGELEGCEQQCNALLRINPTCEEAIMMLADLMLRKNRYEDAAFHFLQLLDKKPDNFSAMVEYIKLLRRAGHLSEASVVIQAAEKTVRPGQKPDPGFAFAKGLFHRFTNNSREALKEFNAARQPRDNPYSQPATIAMIETYIMPDNENLWEDSKEGTDIQENIQMAQRLLKEVRNPTKRAVLDAYSLMASRKKENLEKALNKFYEMIQGEDESSEKMNVPALVGMATALRIMNQIPKARNHLKRVAKANYNPEEDDDYERGWLLLADIYIGSGKYDLAQELLKRAIQANKSCCRAWEAMGVIFEKEQSYKDAADCYENAWKLVSEVDPGIGYKLAFNYLKAKKYVQAIDICHSVLAAHPQYPKIKKEVLERARSMLRP